MGELSNRQVHARYNDLEMECPFCHPAQSVLQNKLAFAIYDRSPVSPGHLLILPFRHAETYFQATTAEKFALWELLDQGKLILHKKYHPDGYNIGINSGPAAGQTVMHLHIHLIPRYKGDLEDPRGGVRGVIPDKRIY